MWLKIASLASSLVSPPTRTRRSGFFKKPGDRNEHWATSRVYRDGEVEVTVEGVTFPGTFAASLGKYTWRAHVSDN